MNPRPVLDGTCASLARAHAEPLAGTAPVAASWLVVEQPGPWGRDALTESHLDADVARTLAARVEGLPVRVLLARHAGRHPDDHRGAARSVWTACTTPGGSWLRHHCVEDPRALLDVDLDALAAGDPGAASGAVDVPEPVVFVCTNGRRDRCCALRGRDVASGLADRLGAERVWECSHLGGHRFAATALVLPSGVVHGRLDTEQALHVVAEAARGHLVPDGYRGRSTWERPAQVAEAAVRARTGLTGLDAVAAGAPAPGEGGHVVEVTTADGARFAVTVAEREGSGARPESCGKADVPLRWLAAVDVTALDGRGTAH